MTMFLDMMYEGAVFIDIAVAIKAKGNMDVFAQLLAGNGHPRLELDFQNGLAINVTGDEIGTLPVIIQAQTIETVVCQASCNLWKL